MEYTVTTSKDCDKQINVLINNLVFIRVYFLYMVTRKSNITTAEL